jgi:acyl carrier protein
MQRTKKDAMKDTTYTIICDVLARYFEVQRADIRPDQLFARDWGVDLQELDVIGMRLERALHLRIRPSELATVQSIGQFIALVRALQRRAEFERKTVTGEVAQSEKSAGTLTVH